MTSVERESLPRHLPIFPLTGALLLPGGHLPLNIFEPRYLQMTRDALQGAGLIGMVQPSDRDREPPAVYRTGCAGRISAHRDTDDGRVLLTLTGLCRFDVVEELTLETPYRQVVADFDAYADDLLPSSPSADVKPALLDAARRFFEAHRISADWSTIEQAPVTNLVTSFSMICPFEPSEKQALLEARDIDRRARILLALLQMGGASSAPAVGGARH